MKSQDVGLLLKLVSLHKQERVDVADKVRQAWPDDWEDWDDRNGQGSQLEMAKTYSIDKQDYLVSRYTARALAQFC